MAVIHVTEAEAARDLHALLDNVREGNEVRIEAEDTLFSVQLTSDLKPRRLSEAIAALEKRGSNAVLPSGFAEDVLDGIQSHQHEYLTGSWE